MEIINKNIIITGAASGIGWALVQQMAIFEGTKIVAVDINPLPKELSNVCFFMVNCMTQSGNDAIFDFAKMHFGSIDIFVANAGFAYYESFEKVDYQHIESIFKLNVLTPIYVFQRMKAEQQQPNLTVMTASAMAMVGIPGYAVYAATKAALDRFAATFWFENQSNARLMLVYPVATKSAFFKNSVQNKDLPVTPFPAHSPEFVAKKMISGILNNKKRVFPSLLFSVALLPLRLFEILAWPYQKYYAKFLKK